MSATTELVSLRYWAAAAHAAGVSGDDVEVTGATSLGVLMEEAKRRHPSRSFSDVLDTCSVLVGDRPVGRGSAAEVSVHPGDTVEFLPPFAGG